MGGTIKNSTSARSVANVTIMRALMAKDLRFFRTPIISLIVAAAGAFLFSACMASMDYADIVVYRRHQSMGLGGLALLFAVLFVGVISAVTVVSSLLAGNWRRFALAFIGLTPAIVAARFLGPSMETLIYRRPLYTALMVSCGLSMFLTTMVASAFGGIALAGERNDRTADFLALLPVTRRQIVASKLIVGVSILLGLFAFYTALVVAGTSFLSPEDATHILEMESVYISLGLTLFGVAWLLGSFSSSAAISATASIGVSFGVEACLLLQGRDLFQGHDGRNPWILLLPLGLLSLISGTVYYLRRIAP